MRITNLREAVQIKTLCVVFGGLSGEHEVSLRSATLVLKEVDREAFSVVMLGITKNGRWLMYDGPLELIESGGWESSGQTRPAVISPDRGHGGIFLPEENKAVPLDVVFGVLHGEGGEDGTLQGLLELAGIPYVGCGVLSSALCMDKAVSHELLVAAGIPKTGLIAVNKGDDGDFSALEARLARELGYPMFVKPSNTGSSVGVSRARNPGELKGAIDFAFKYGNKLVVEREVKGQEVECAVMGELEPIAAESLGEIVPEDFYSYDAKYLDDSASLIVPARLGGETAQKIKTLAKKAYRVLCCRGFARVDFFVREDGEIILNEINTIPGFTSISMFPRLFAEGGLSGRELVARLIDMARCDSPRHS
ncbi:MAG: D-alanine--D-alanine ligase [Oscillospiraceae bacterium]|nr:D-alanine--D-alanine ligase [Oscillospiraceae bacterium]